MDYILHGLITLMCKDVILPSSPLSLPQRYFRQNRRQHLGCLQMHRCGSSVNIIHCSSLHNLHQSRMKLLNQHQCDAESSGNNPNCGKCLEVFCGVVRQHPGITNATGICSLICRDGVEEKSYSCAHEIEVSEEIKV